MLRIVVHDPASGLSVLSSLADARAALAREGAVVWVDMQDRSPEGDELLGELFGFHPLAIEDVYKGDHRPKVEDYDTYLYLILQALERSGGWRLHDLRFQELDVFVGANFLVTHHHGEMRAVDDTLKAFRRDPQALAQGPAFAAHALLDRVVDLYLPLSDAYQDEVERLEKLVLRHDGQRTLERILDVRQGLNRMRRLGALQGQLLERLTRDFDEIPDAARPFFRDVAEHFATFLDRIENHHAEAGALFDLFHTLSNYRMNEVVRMLTVISTIFLPLTFITGLYGMNFDHMPELHSEWGYLLVWGVMLSIVGGMVWVFRKRRWL